MSNLSFVYANTPFSGSYISDVNNIRTLVDLAGLVMLYAYHIQRSELRVKYELDAVKNILQNQYVQYRQSRESIDLINRKYHDLKHQIAVLRAEPDAQKRADYLDEMEMRSETTRPRTRRAIRYWTRYSPARAFTAHAIKSPSPAWPMESCWTSWM